MKINIEELQRVKNFILKYPNMVDMDAYVRFGESDVLVSDSENPHCGSVGCIAGLTVALNMKGGISRESHSDIENKFDDDKYNTDFYRSGIWKKAKAKLGLTAKQADLLFIPDLWPSEYIKALDNSKRMYVEDTSNLEEYAKVIADRIDYFIKTGG